MARLDRFGRGGDQESFVVAGYAAVVFREASENFTRQHAAADTLEGVDFHYLTQNARINAASAASLALAPPAPVVTGARGQNLIARDPSGYDASLSWNPSPGAGGYRVYWRDTWSNQWQHSQATGNVTHLLLPGMSIDDLIFGVAAVDSAGHESLIRAYTSSPGTLPDVELVRP
ncbi:MAG: hypothetical protein ABI616_15315 [Pseudomonadota bacterium]